VLNERLVDGQLKFQITNLVQLLKSLSEENY